MKLRHLWVLGMSSMIILSACGQNSDESDQKDNDHKTHKKADKNSNKSEKQSNHTEVDQDSNQDTQNNANKKPKTKKQHTQNNQPITTDQAKSIAYNSKDIQGFVQDKDELIYNKDKSNDDEVFIETPFGGMNMSVKHHAIIDRNTGEIIKTGGGITHPDGPIDNEDGYIDKDTYNTTANFYNTYVYKQGMPEYEKASSDVPEEKYKKLSDLVVNYSKEQREREKENESNGASTKNNKSQDDNEGKRSDSDNNQSTNEQSSNKNKENNKSSNKEKVDEQHPSEDNEDNKSSNQKQKSDEHQENKNDEASNKNNDSDITAQEAEDIVYDWYQHTGYGARLRDEFHVNKDKSNNNEYYIDFASSDARGHPIKSQAIVDKESEKIKEITYLSSEEPEVDKALPKKEEKI